MNLIKPLATEKAMRLLESENKITFIVDRRTNKQEIKKEIEKTFKVKVHSMSTHIRNNQKIAIIRLNKENPAIDIATKIGLM